MGLFSFIRFVFVVFVFLYVMGPLYVAVLSHAFNMLVLLISILALLLGVGGVILLAHKVIGLGKEKTEDRAFKFTLRKKRGSSKKSYDTSLASLSNYSVEEETDQISRRIERKKIIDQHKRKINSLMEMMPDSQIDLESRHFEFEMAQREADFNTCFEDLPLR